MGIFVVKLSKSLSRAEKGGKMRVYVTEGHIRKGVPNSSRGCPVAIALSEVIGNEVEVTRYTWKGKIQGVEKVQRLSNEVIQKVFEYDCIGVMSPFDFEIE